jgi:signal transduction histidine kinase
MTFGQPGYYTEEHARLVQAFAQQAAVAMENAHLYGQAQELATMAERARLARELHDSVSQALYGIALGARTARTLADRDPTRLSEPLDYVLSLAEAGLAELRALIYELRPESLEHEGLVAALERQAAALRARHELLVTLDLHGEPDVPLAVKEALYRIAQEAMQNAVKHARATSIVLHLTQTEEQIALEVQDNGIGFDPLGSFPGHLGLQTMRERAERVGGQLRLESSPQHGTQVLLTVPRQPVPMRMGGAAPLVRRPDARVGKP